MEYWILYLCSIATDLANSFIGIGVVVLISGIFLFFANICASQDDCTNGGCYNCCLAKTLTHTVKLKGVKTLVYGVILIFFGCLIPSSTQCYSIFGIGSTLQYFKNSEQAKELPDNAIKAINGYLESLTKEESKNE